MYVLINLLFEEASLVPIQVKLLSNNKLQRNQRKKYKTNQGKIILLWEQLNNKEIKAKHLLKKCSRLHSPVEI
jgi:hypothetical protein